MRSGNRRNCLVIALLVLLPAAELVTHLAHHGRVALAPWLGVQLGLDVVLFIIAVMAGRVVPMFTNNGMAGAKARRFGWLERHELIFR